MPDTARIDAIFERLRAHNPHPTTELVYRSPFELLVAVVLSAQATDASVNQATSRLFAVARTPRSLLALGEEGLKPYINRIGLYNAKAMHLIALCHQLLERHAGKVPETREALEALPGVGRKTANVLLNTLFGQPTLAVDTHVFRVAHRLGLSRGRTPLAVERDLLRRVPRRFLDNAHHWLILHGRYVCQARKPKCGICPLRDLCPYPRKTPPSAL